MDYGEVGEEFCVLVGFDEESVGMDFCEGAIVHGLVDGFYGDSVEEHFFKGFWSHGVSPPFGG